MYIFSAPLAEGSEHQCWWTWEWLSWLFRNHQCMLQSIWCDSGTSVYRWRRVFNFGSGYIDSCPSRALGGLKPLWLCRQHLGDRQQTLTAAEVLHLFGLERQFSPTVNFLCQSSHNGSACTVNKDRKESSEVRREGGGGGHLSHLDSKDNQTLNVRSLTRSRLAALF